MKKHRVKMSKKNCKLPDGLYTNNLSHFINSIQFNLHLFV